MKTTFYLLLTALILPLTLPASAAPDRFERKEAATWVKEEMNRRKKTLALLKRVKDEKSAEKVGKALLEMYDAGGEETALGETGPAPKPTGEAMAAAEEKNAKALEKMQKAIAAERERIAELEIESSTLTKALNAMDAAAESDAFASDSEESDAF